jgi:hypothetical protein
MEKPRRIIYKQTSTGMKTKPWPKNPGTKKKKELLQITQTGGERGGRKLKRQETSKRHNETKKGYKKRETAKAKIKTITGEEKHQKKTQKHKKKKEKEDSRRTRTRTRRTRRRRTVYDVDWPIGDDGKIEEDGTETKQLRKWGADGRHNIKRPKLLAVAY